MSALMTNVVYVRLIQKVIVTCFSSVFTARPCLSSCSIGLVLVTQTKVISCGLAGLEEGIQGQK